MRRFIKIKDWFCHHSHLDKSNLIHNKNFHLSNTHMKSKWYLFRELKKQYTIDDLLNRMDKTTHNLYRQGCKGIRTFLDVDDYVGMKCIEAGNILKNKWKDKIEIQLATQPLEGLESIENVKLFEKATTYVDIIGCLPGRDSMPEKHLDIVFDIAKQQNKSVEAHLDQCNIPEEKETELFCDFVEKYNYQGKSRSIHSISLSCHPTAYQYDIANRLKDLNISVIVCPSAAISMKQEINKISPIHNSIAPVNILHDCGVDICLGIDNISDIFMPLVDGDIEFELRLLAESTRMYDIDFLEKLLLNSTGFQLVSDK